MQAGRDREGLILSSFEYWALVAPNLKQGGKKESKLCINDLSTQLLAISDSLDFGKNKTDTPVMEEIFESFYFCKSKLKHRFCF